jgi:hypothetical protein
MRIGIDISQLAYPGTGVAKYLENFVESLIRYDEENEYTLFFSSFRGSLNSKLLQYKSQSNVKFKFSKLPPTILDLMWNKMHKFPVENFVGNVDWFITSDWTEPPARHAKKATVIYDMVIYKYPQETHSKTEFGLKNFLISPNIVTSQKRKLEWVKKESDIVFAISKSTKKDIEEILNLSSEKVKVIYPAFNL